MVDTRLATIDDDPVSLSYVLTSTDDKPRIVDVVAMGVSNLAILRSEYSSVLKSDGPSGLASRIDDLATKNLRQ